MRGHVRDDVRVKCHQLMYHTLCKLIDPALKAGKR